MRDSRNSNTEIPKQKKRTSFTTVLPLKGLTFLNLFELLDCLVVSRTSMFVIKFNLLNFSSRNIGIINVEQLFFKILSPTLWIGF